MGKVTPESAGKRRLELEEKEKNLPKFFKNQYQEFDRYHDIARFTKKAITHNKRGKK